MFAEIIRCIKGTCRLSADGNFPERILNIASCHGIFVENAVKTADGKLLFSVSRQGYLLLQKNIPEGISITELSKMGLPYFLRRYRKRIVLLFMPALVCFVLFFFSLFIWNIEIEGGDATLRREVLSALNECNLKKGTLKSTLDPYEIKRKCIIAIDDLAWIWVDISGTTANVRLQKRTAVPNRERINEPADVFSSETGVIEKMEVFCGSALFTPGMTVEKGDLLVTGVLTNENENIPVYFHHASAHITARVWREKNVLIPKKTEKRTPTGAEKSIYTIKIKKNNINFSLNSGISYKEYDKISSGIKVPFIPLSFIRTKIVEVISEETETDTEALIKEATDSFVASLKRNNAEVISIAPHISSETDEDISLRLTAECIVRIDKEIPIDPQNYTYERTSLHDTINKE